MITSNMTGRHQGPKRKLVTQHHHYNGWAGYRVPSLKQTSCPKCRYHNACHFSSSSVVSCTFSALCVYLKFGHHPHP